MLRMSDDLGKGSLLVAIVVIIPILLGVYVHAFHETPKIQLALAVSQQQTLLAKPGVWGLHGL